MTVIVEENAKRILFHKYEILEQIGQGTEGSVFLARDQHLDRLVAIKEGSDGIVREKVQGADLKREGELLKELDHPGLPQIYDLFKEQGKTYLVMEYVEGITLRKYLLSNGKVPCKQAVTWTVELCQVLSYLHEGGRELIYRDLKPENIMIRPDGSLKLIDLGGVLGSTYGARREHDLAGTPGYCPPEQWKECRSDKTWDIYALGAVFHEMVTGAAPGQCAGLRLPIRVYDKSLPKELERVVEICTHEKREKRFQNMEQVREALLGDGRKEKRRKLFWRIKGLPVWILLCLATVTFCYPLLMGVSEYEIPFPFLRAPLLFLGAAVVFKLLIYGRRDKQILRKQEKSIRLTEKKFLGLYGMVFFLLGSALGGMFCRANAGAGGDWSRKSSIVYAGEKEERLWVEMRDDLGRKLLLKDGAVYMPQECVRFELPSDRLPEGVLSLQMVAEGEEGSLYVSRVFLIEGQGANCY